jgi:DNA polymerase III delta subunit
MWQNPNVLNAALRQNPPKRLIVISGDLVRLRLLAEQLGQYFGKQGFTRHKGFFDDNYDYWREEWQSGTLWEGQRFYQITALRLPDFAFAELFCQQAAADLALLLLLPELDRRDQQKKPLALLAKHALAIAAPTLSGSAYVRWLREEAAPTLGLRLTPDAAEALAWHCQGASLAAMQTLQHLSLLAQNPLITLEIIQPLLQEQSQFSIYAWLEALLAGHSQESFRIFKFLQQELAPAEVLWHLGKLLRDVEAIGSGASASERGLFPSKENLYRQAAKRCPPARCRRYLQELLYLDQVGKGQISAIFWEALAYLTQAFTQE